METASDLHDSSAGRSTHSHCRGNSTESLGTMGPREVRQLLRSYLEASQWLSSKESACNAGDLQEMQIQPLGGEDPLEKETATHPSILAWEVP